MAEHQNLKNHGRFIPLWHYVTPVLILALLTAGIINLVKSSADNIYAAASIVLTAVIFIIVFWYARWFALRAQDRAIRAEENLRHFILTGKPLDKKLHTSQIVALRFAPDEEFVELAKKASEEKLRSRHIKKMIKKWKSDHHRV